MYCCSHLSEIPDLQQGYYMIYKHAAVTLSFYIAVIQPDDLVIAEICSYF